MVMAYDRADDESFHGSISFWISATHNKEEEERQSGHPHAVMA
jgi:hypothetical protein